MSLAPAVGIQYFAPPRSLRDEISTLFLLEVDLPEGEFVTDYLLPEWATLRFFSGGFVSAENRRGDAYSETRFPVTGPHTQETRFRIASGHHWGFSLQPLGWARLVGAPAHDFANALVDGETCDLFAPFRPLLQRIADKPHDRQIEMDRIVDFLETMPRNAVGQETLINDISGQLLNPYVCTAAQLAKSVGASARTLERICRRVFGFSPKMLLRRRRFMRSITDFMLDPSLRWIGAIDAVYHDQAHFVRDFKTFMGMKPSEYAELDKPILEHVVRERDRFVRDAAKTAPTVSVPIVPTLPA